jgi:hypothetical protein
VFEQLWGKDVKKLLLFFRLLELGEWVIFTNWMLWVVKNTFDVIDIYTTLF